jgi:hypothetical protein
LISKQAQKSSQWLWQGHIMTLSRDTLEDLGTHPIGNFGNLLWITLGNRLELQRYPSRHWRREGEEVYGNSELRLLAPDEIGSKAALVPRQGMVDFEEEPFLVLRQSAGQIQIIGVVITG